jgi:hypothetical protein
MIWLRHSAARRIALVAFGVYAAAMLLLGRRSIMPPMPPSRARSPQRGAGQRRADRAISSRGWRAFRAPSPCSKAQGRSRWAPRFFARRAAAGGQSFHRRPRARLAPHHLLDPLEGRDTARAKATLLPGGYRLVVAADLEDLEAIDRAILAIFAVAMLALLALGVGRAGAGALSARQAGGDRGHRLAIIAGDLATRAPPARMATSLTGWPPRSTPCSTGSPR